MTAKEKLLREVLDLDEADAAAARIVIERRHAKTDGELEAVLDEEADEMLDEMDVEEKSDGVREPCALALDNTFAPRKALLTRRIAKLGAEKMDEVCRALRMATSC